jgi:DNA recombination protein RmuC
MEINIDAIIVLALIAALLGGLITYLLAQKKIAQLREKNAALEATLELERTAANDRQNIIERSREQFSAVFAALSGEALKNNNEAFLKLAQENLKQFNIQAQGELSKKEQAIEHLIKPIKEVLEKTEKQIRDIERDRKEAYGSITKHLETMAQTQQLLHGETRNLAQALRRPEVRGQWGEMTLKRLVELAGMVQYCDFFEQEHTASEEGNIRPDMIVRMPGGREIVVDVKTPLDAYLNAVEALDDKLRDQHLAHHARKVRERIRELASKSYWSQFKNSPDFVVLFIPGDHFLSAALDKDPQLLEDALRQKVILATPTSLVALLRAVAFGWNQQAITENAEKIRDLGEDLYKRLATFTGHLARLGKNINSSVEHYNSAVGSFQRQVMPGARKFSELGITEPKTSETLEPVEKITRSLNQDELQG